MWKTLKQLDLGILKGISLNLKFLWVFSFLGSDFTPITVQDCRHWAVVSLPWSCVAASDGHDKLFCTKAITIIDNLKKPGAIPIIDLSQFLKAISVIDKLSPINFSDNRCGKFSMCLTKFFFASQLPKCFSRFFKKRKQFTASAMALNTTKRDFLKIATRPCILLY